MYNHALKKIILSKKLKDMVSLDHWLGACFVHKHYSETSCFKALNEMNSFIFLL